MPLLSVLPLSMTNPSDVLDMPVDPNEPTYCLCHQVSYGEMIGCDNPDVSTCDLEIQMLEVFVAISEINFCISIQKCFIELMVVKSVYLHFLY